MSSFSKMAMDSRLVFAVLILLSCFLIARHVPVSAPEDAVRVYLAVFGAGIFVMALLWLIGILATKYNVKVFSTSPGEDYVSLRTKWLIWAVLLVLGMLLFSFLI